MLRVSEYYDGCLQRTFREPRERLSIEPESNAVRDEIVLRTRTNYCCMGLWVLCVAVCVGGVFEWFV